MKAIGILVVAVGLTGLAACIQYPTTGVEITDERPTIAFKGAPFAAVVFVDGLSHGLAAGYDGVKKSLVVEPGNHLVEVRDGDRVLLTERVFLANRATKTFIVQ